MNHMQYRRMRQLLAVSGFLAMSRGVDAAPPLWWNEGAPPVVDSQVSPNNHGVANVGQAKWMAKSALNALRGVRPTTADAIEAELVGTGKPIASWTVPVTQEQKDAQHAPLLIGQLKAIAAPFYSKLHEVDATWLEAQLVQNQTKDANDSTNFLPWSSSPADDANKAATTIGQLKAVFSLRFEALPSNSSNDSDSDGLPDDWEAELLQWYNAQNPGNLLTDITPGGDVDSDGLGNLHEYQIHTDPKFPDHPAVEMQVEASGQ